MVKIVRTKKEDYNMRIGDNRCGICGRKKNNSISWCKSCEKKISQGKLMYGFK